MFYTFSNEFYTTLQGSLRTLIIYKVYCKSFLSMECFTAPVSSEKRTSYLQPHSDILPLSKYSLCQVDKKCPQVLKLQSLRIWTSNNGPLNWQYCTAHPAKRCFLERQIKYAQSFWWWTKSTLVSSLERLIGCPVSLTDSYTLMREQSHHTMMQTACMASDKSEVIHFRHLF